MITVYAITNGIPIKATINIIPNVFCEDAALYIFKLFSITGLDNTIFGNIPIANKTNSNAMLADEERNARNSLPL